MMNDPIGDMLTRIRNGQMRGKTTVETPASKLRAWVLDVLADEGYIRGYEKNDGKDGHPAFEISLKYYEGEACHSRSEAGLQARSPRLHGRQGPAERPPGPGRVDCLHPQGRDVGCKCTGRQRRRRSALHRLLRRAQCLVLVRNRSSCPPGLTANVSGQTIEVKGPKGTRSFNATDDVTLAVEDGAVTVTPRGKSKRARQQWGMTRSMVRTSSSA